MYHPRKGFTLIELLVVIAIIAILAIVVVLTLNPAELLRQSRDGNRVSDMATLNSAINLYNTDQSGSPTYSLGSPNTVYVSIPDPVATTTAGDQCQGLGLISLPSGYSYHCAASSTYRNVNGSGWIPVNLSLISSGSPLGSLPVDSTNSSSSRLYYTYETNGSQFETTAVMESQKYQLGGSNDVISPDGGTLASVYEKGSRLGLEPLDYGDNTLVGFWPLNEGTNSTAYDDSGNNATGSWSGTQAGTSGYYSPGKVQSWAGAFNGTSTNTYVAISSSSTLNISGALTITAWVLPTITEPSYGGIAVHRTLGTTMDYGMDARGGGVAFNYSNGSTWFDSGVASGDATSVWHLLVITRNSAGTIISFYGDGMFIGSGGGVGTAGSWNNALILGADLGIPQYFTGSINNVRIYNRALSAAQIAAMYNGGK
jgi:prepilin-type N-terminal cleavage/methylation domain-containing protein